VTPREDEVPGAGSHPDPGLLAAHAERRLSATEAAQVEAHLARCSRCHEEFAETLRFALDEEEEAPVPNRPLAFTRRPAFRFLVGLAAAAALVLAVRQFWPARQAPAKPSLLADLARAMGTKRFIEPRVTGGFQHSRLIVLRSGERPQGLDAHSPAVLAAVARVRERAEKDSSAEAQGALGVTYLVSGDVNAALRTLESAIEQAPQDPQILTDLSAAYLVRAARLDEPADLPKALESAEKAIERPDAPVEAWFNRALALERLHLVDAANRAWDDYLKRDPNSGWADEARQHKENLPKKKQSSVEQDRARVRAAIDEGTEAVDRLATDNPSLLRDYFQDVILPSWAEAHLAARPEATRIRAEADLLGDALFRSTGDALPRDTARALIQPEKTATSPDPLRAQAQGFLALQKAQRQAAATQPACPAARDGSRELEGGGSPRVVWARLRVVVHCLYGVDSPRARRELVGLEALSASRGYLQLLGRVHWMRGLVAIEDGNLTESLTAYRLALGELLRIGEREKAAGLLGQEAQTRRSLGDRRGAWRTRTDGLARMGEAREARDRQALLEEAVQACVAEKTPRSGLHFQDALVTTATGLSVAAPASLALLRRASLHQTLGNLEAANVDLNSAIRWIGHTADPVMTARLTALSQATMADLILDRQPADAAILLRESLAHFRSTALQVVPAIHLRLARALVKQGQASLAERELRAGIEELERLRTGLRGSSDRISYLDQGLPLFDEMVRLQLDRGDPEGALSFLERARSRQLVESLRRPDSMQARSAADDTPLPARALQQGLQEDVALIYYAALDDRLLIWVLSRRDCRFLERSLGGRRLRSMVARNRAALEQGAVPGGARSSGTDLHDELVRPVLPALGSARVLVVIPDASVQSVPFASLVDRETGRYVVEDYLVGVAPSGTAFVRTSHAASAGSPLRHALIIGNPRSGRDADISLPDLPGAHAEATEVATLYESADLLTGAQATRGAFLESLPRSDVVHYAGHAIPSTESGSSGWLSFSPESPSEPSGLLPLSELVLGRVRRTRVVILAGCRTAAGPVSPTEGALSLGRPFLAAGVPDVVLSLWDIDDHVSKRFFVAFHRSLQALGEPMMALRRAQLALLRDNDPLVAHPANWAAFICMGGLDRQKARSLDL
jgi:CHAT domain-containing protein